MVQNSDLADDPEVSRLGSIYPCDERLSRARPRRIGARSQCQPEDRRRRVALHLSRAGRSWPSGRSVGIGPEIAVKPFAIRA
jgi:hypothetical protein